MYFWVKQGKLYDGAWFHLSRIDCCVIVFSISSESMLWHQTEEKKKQQQPSSTFLSKTNDGSFTVRPAMDTFDLCSLCHGKIMLTHVLVCLHVSSVSSELQVRWRSMWRWGPSVCLVKPNQVVFLKDKDQQCSYMIPRFSITVRGAWAVPHPEESVTSAPEHELLWCYF